MQDDVAPRPPAAPGGRCLVCGATLVPGAMFCTSCGARVRTGEPTEQITLPVEAAQPTEEVVRPAPAAAPPAWTPPPQATTVMPPSAYQPPYAGQPYAGRQRYAGDPYAAAYPTAPSFQKLLPAMLLGILGGAASVVGIWIQVLESAGVTVSLWQEGFVNTGTTLSTCYAICAIALLVAAAGVLLAGVVRSAALFWLSGIIATCAAAAALAWTLMKIAELPQPSQPLIHLSWGWAVLGAGALLILAAAGVATVQSRRYRLH